MKYARDFTASFSLSLLCFFFLSIGFSQAALAADSSESNQILILPVKVTSLNSDTTLASAVDNQFKEIIDADGLSFLSRQEAEKLLSYNENWPPPADILQKRSPFNKYIYVAAGNLTELGGQIRIDLKVYDLLTDATPRYFSATGNYPDELTVVCKKILGQISRLTDTKDIIASISPAGNSKIDSGAILKNILTKPGDLYDPAALRKDLKAIYEMGYFDDVHIEVKQTDSGKAVTFRVTEKPVIASFTITGFDKLKEEDVKTVTTVKEQDILNPPQLTRDSEAIKTYYRSKGYYNTEVETNISYPTKDTADVTFNITEGKKIYIKDIEFEGNVTFDDDELADQMETNTKGFFSWLTNSGLLDQDKLNQDASRIITFYGDNGFLDAKISDPIISQEEEWLHVSFAIEEGTRYKVGKVNIEGDLIEDKDKMLDSLSTPKITYISRKVLREDILKITDLYSEQGYANASVRPSINKGATDDTLDITIKIDKGELVYINRITIEGNSRTRDNVIRRKLQVNEGDIFDTKALRESIQKLQYLEFFDEVNITPEPSFSENAVDLNVEVKEKSTGQFSIGAGYSSVDHLLFMGEISENNFMGTGNTLSFGADVGGDSNQYNLTYKNPMFRDSQLSWSASLFQTYREYDDYTKESRGGKLRFGYPIWGQWRGYAAYGYTDTDLSDIDDDASYIIQASADIHITSSVEFTLSRDTRDRQFGPSRGSVNTLTTTYAGGPFGGDSEFTKIEAASSWYFPLFWSTVFHVKGAAGQVFENEDDALPVYERFYLGGLSSIRGFDYADVSPKDEDTGDAIGGDKMWYTNWEFIFPLLKEYGVKGVIFYDMGYSYDDDEDWDLGFDTIKKSAGAGIRWYSPMGPMRLEWGYNLDPEDDEDDSVWDFSLGGTF